MHSKDGHKTYLFLEIVNKNDLQHNLYDFDDAVENVKIVGKVLNVAVKRARDDGKNAVEEREDGSESQQHLVQVKRLFLDIRFGIESLDPFDADQTRQDAHRVQDGVGYLGQELCLVLLALVSI